MAKQERHILALSGGKDSAALAVYMREKRPDLPMEYVFIDSGHELPETYAYLEKIRAILNVSINVIRPQRDFDYWLKYFNGVLPSPNNRWCTRLLKLSPYKEWVDKKHKDCIIYSYVGIRADEDREGFRPTTEGFISQHPFVKDGLVLENIKQILHDSGLGLPGYYSWRKRSGCFFCFFQRDDEWRGLRQHHPDLFQQACRYEEKHADGRNYTWRDNGFLRDMSDSAICQQFTPKKSKRPLLVDSLASIIRRSRNEISVLKGKNRHA